MKQVGSSALAGVGFMMFMVALSTMNAWVAVPLAIVGTVLVVVGGFLLYETFE